MKKNLIFALLLNTVFTLNLFSSGSPDHPLNATQELEKQYQFHRDLPSDINEHLPTLKELARKCSSAIEIGIRGIVSSWAVLQGLSESSCPNRSYIGIDIDPPKEEKLSLLKKLSHAHGIKFFFIQGNDMEVDIEPADLLFIDSLHTYCHLTYELEKFSPKIRKYIALHDTSAPWGDCDDDHYFGNYSEYPSHYDRTKKGLWPAVMDFLDRHPEWTLEARYYNNHGFTILKRRELNAI